MADYMEEDLGEPLPLQEDLTCPVCQGIFRDPVLLPCSHSFCRDCLERSWRMNKKCPVCRHPFEADHAITNRALNSACESFTKEKNWRRPQKRSDDLCYLHQRELQLYCVHDEEPVCVECVTLHATHQLLPLNKGAPFCKEELNIKVQIFENKVETYKKMKQKFLNTVEFIKYQAGQAEKQIKSEFERLHKVLVTEEALRLKALTDEEEEKISDMQNMIDMTSQDIAALNDLIQNLQKEMGNDDLPFLRKFQTLKRGAQWSSEDPQYPEDCLLNLGRHVGSLSYNVWKNMQAHVKYNPVVLNPNTASPWLSLNPDLTSVKDSSERQVAPDNLERFDPCVFILGAEGFTSGKHRWDVIVSDNPKWIVGVCKESLARKKKFTVSPDRGVWAIGLSKGVYSALHPQRTTLPVEQRPERIRVKLNMDKGEVSFWDGGTAKHLCTFTHTFNEKVFPLFGPGLHSTPMVMAPGKIAVHTS
ncbi:tripartite motif containing 35-28 [Diretmus argenteus]